MILNGEEVIFTAKEFDLRTFLATNPHIVFSKDHLYEGVWGYDSIGDTTTVTVHTRKIRDKTEDDPSNPQFIETTWGVGYRLKKYRVLHSYWRDWTREGASITLHATFNDVLAL